MDKTVLFFERHGPRAIVLARFVPIVRTFAPFVAGVGQMNYTKFASYNIVGAVAWVLSLSLAGYFFGQIPFIKKNFEIVVVAIVAISVLPVVFEFVRAKLSGIKEAESAACAKED